jgi:PIN domain nuclease of toxin-antitoxin system
VSDVLLDTHLLLWAATDAGRLSPAARAVIEDRSNRLCFSVASIWEIAIKWASRPERRMPEPRLFRRGLLEAEYDEVPILADHVMQTASLPLIHGDPFDRLLLAQAEAEGMTLLTADRLLARYPGPVRFVG